MLSDPTNEENLMIFQFFKLLFFFTLFFLKVPDNLPADFTKLFHSDLHKFDVNCVEEVLSLYEELNVVHEPLTLIPPQVL